MEFKNRQDVIDALERDFKQNPAGFCNNEKTKSREKFWTFNRLMKYYYELKRDWTIHEDGSRTRHSLNGVPLSEILRESNGNS